MRSSFTILFTGVLAILFFSCSTPKDLEYRDFRNFTVNRLGFASSAVKMDLVYYNPNNFALQLKTTDLDIFIDSGYLGHSTQEYQVTIPKRSEFTLPIVVEVEMKNLFKNALIAAFNKDVEVRVLGNVKVGKFNIYKNFVVNYKGRHEIPPLF